MSMPTPNVLALGVLPEPLDKLVDLLLDEAGLIAQLTVIDPHHRDGCKYIEYFQRRLRERQ